MSEIPHAVDLLLIVLALAAGGLLASLPLININWKCFIGRHQYRYIGTRSGLHVDTYRGLVGTTRRLYRCGRCSKTKPVEEEDYE